MKYQYTFGLILILLCSPLFIRLVSPALYTSGLGSDPYLGPLLAILLDITCMWFTLVIIILSHRLTRWLRSRG